MTGAGAGMVWSALAWSAALVSLAALIALPIGVGAAIYLEEYGVRGRLGRVIDGGDGHLESIPQLLRAEAVDLLHFEGRGADGKGQVC